MERSVDDIFIFVDDDEEHGQENFFVKYVLFSITKIILSSTNIFVIHNHPLSTQTHTEDGTRNSQSSLQRIMEDKNKYQLLNMGL